MSQTKLFDIEQLAYLSDEAFIHHCFVRAFRRVCNPSRAMQYLIALANGRSRNEVLESILQENECGHQINTFMLRKLPLLDGVAFIREAYRRILGRQVDQSGLEHYLQRLSKGETKTRILYELGTSSEGQARQALHKQLRDFVEVLSGEDISHGLVKLKDVQRLIGLEGDEFILEAYRLFLKREADTAGLAAYQRVLLDGIKTIRILYSLAYSDEGKKFQKTVPVWLYLVFWRFI